MKDSRPSSILIFTSKLHGGGAESHLVRIANFLAQDFKVEVVPNVAGGAYEKLLLPSVKLCPLFSRTWGSSTLDMARSVLPLRKRIEGGSYNIVCAIQSHAGVAAATALRSLQLDKHPHLVICPQLPFRRELEALPSIFRPIYTKYLRRALNDSSSIVALSNGVRDELVKGGMANPAIISVIHNACIDPRIEEWIREPLSQELVISFTNQNVLVACGRLVPQKGFDILLEALSRVKSKITTLILGDGPERDNLINQAEKLGISSSVSFHGFVENPYKIISRAKVFVLSSRFEGFGNVVAEAMACGVPVIASNCQYGPSEIITHGEDGLLVPPGDIDALARAIDKVIIERPWAENFAKKGEVSSRRFAADAVGILFRDHFQSLINVGTKRE